MNIVYFDLESQKLFEDVGGRDASKLLLACGVTWAKARLLVRIVVRST